MTAAIEYDKRGLGIFSQQPGVYPLLTPHTTIVFLPKVSGFRSDQVPVLLGFEIFSAITNIVSSNWETHVLSRQPRGTAPRVQFRKTTP